MTIFGNSGIRWPNHEVESAKAGSQSLQAASELFNILASIEAGGARAVQGETLESSAQGFERAAEAYERIARKLTGEPIGIISPSQFEMAFAGDSWRDYGDYRLRGRREFDSVGELYFELAHRLRRLAALMKALNLNADAHDLAPQAFQAMGLFSSASALARLIAVLGREDDGERP